MGFKGFILKKAIAAIITVVVIVCVNFVIFRIAPGDPIRMMFRDPRISAEQLEEMRHKYHLDGSMGEQFVYYMKSMAQGDLGISFGSKRPVLELIIERVPNTLMLVLTALTCAIFIGISLGAFAGWRSGTKIDTMILSTALAFYSIPTFALGILLLLLFAYVIPIFPLGGMVTPAAGLHGFAYLRDLLWHMCLPAFTVTLWYIGEYVLFTRSSMMDVLHQDFILTARAKGLKESVVLRTHALRNALLPVVTITGVNLGFAVAGVIEAETVYSWPGAGMLVYDAVMKRDYPLLQGVFLLFACSVVLANFTIDLIYGYIDPRIKVGEG
ncbi:MAG: ABC transporter permease [Desulfobacterales bacterium]|nr:ABC transporter permease [Desulfobacterales bacterium]